MNDERRHRSVPKHGNYNPREVGWCPRCRDELLAREFGVNVAQSQRGLPDMAPDPTDQARQAVVAAAVAWRATKRPGDYSLLNATGQLVEAIDALQSLTTPAGKAPSEVEPGTRFRFALVEGKSEAGRGSYTLVEDLKHGCERRFVDGNSVYSFRCGDRIIPLLKEP